MRRQYRSKADPPHRGQLLQERAQDLFCFCFSGVIRRDFAEAPTNFRLQSRMQVSYANAGSVSQIFRTHQRFTAKPGNIRLSNSAHAASIARRDGSMAAASR